jgi:hypothetical protein
VHACDGGNGAAARREVENSVLPMEVGSFSIVADGCAHWVLESAKAIHLPLCMKQPGSIIKSYRALRASPHEGTNSEGELKKRQNGVD